MTDLSLLLLLLLALLQLADGWTTWRILRMGGQELNPVILRLMLSIGIVPALMLKGIAVIAAAWFFFLPYPWALGAMAAVQAVVVAFNFRSIK